MLFNYEKSIIDDKYFNSGKELVHCYSRKKLIIKTPEEIVRQKFLFHLITELNVNPSLIEVEVQLSEFKKGSKYRADIIIYDSNRQPFLLIELKAVDVPLTDNVFNQIERYNKIVNAKFLCISNGEYTHAFKYDKTKLEYRELDFGLNFQSIIDNRIKILNEELAPWKRSGLDELLKNSYLDDYTNLVYETPTKERRYILSNDSPDEIKRLSISLVDLFMDDTEKLKTIHSKSAKLVEDKGVRFGRYSAYGGYRFEEFYRYFVLLDNYGNHFTINFAVYSYDKYIRESDESFASSHRGTYFMVGIDSQDSSIHSIELKLDKYAKVNGQTVNMTHDGVLTAKYRRPNSLMIDYLKNNQPDLLNGNHIDFGQLNLDKGLHFNDPFVIDFLSKVIDYAYWRERLKNELKQVEKAN